MSECIWQPCSQEVYGEAQFCFFHSKRAKGLLSGSIGSGLHYFSEPPKRVKAIIEALYDNDKEDS